MMDNRQLGLDLISDLPVGLIENILVCLPISYAIRTSILSTKWRFKWTTLPSLVFEKKYMNMSFDENDISVEFHNWFKSYVTSTLFRHEGHLHKFMLVSEIPSCSDVHQWFFCILRKDIKELIFKMDKYSMRKFDVPSSLFSFRSLTFLHLSHCRLGPLPPKFEGFLSLKSLILLCVEGPSGTIQSVVAHSPLLETLKLSICDFGPLLPNFKGFLSLRSLALQYVDVPGTLIINAPKLKYLCLAFDAVKKIHLHAPLLANVVLMVDTGEDDITTEKYFHWNYTMFFGGLANLETLAGAFTKLFIIGIEHYEQPLVFHHLKTIKLDDVNFKSTHEILVVVCFIVDASATLYVSFISIILKKKKKKKKSQ